MADVMEHFYRGQEAGQRQSAHKVQLEESKLAQQILKHQVESLKIEDSIRARELTGQNLQAMQGMPASEMPSHDETSTQPNVPARGLSGALMNFNPPQQGGMQGGSPDASTGTTAPIPQQPQGTNDVTSRVPNRVDIPGVPGLGVPGFSARPRTLEEIMQMRQTEELLKPFKLTGDENYYPGGAGGPVVEGPGKDITVPRGGTVINSKTKKVVARGQAGGRGRVQRGMLNGKLAFATVDPDTNRATIGAQDVTGAFTPEPRATGAGAENSQWNRAYREYSGDVAKLQRTHADEMRAWTEKTRNALPGEEPEIPTFTPPSFEEWMNDHPQAGAGLGRPASGGRATGAQGGAPKKGDVKPIPGYPGTEQTYDGAKWVRTK